eukprot:764772-Hanusia_phi.AAC.3
MNDWEQLESLIISWIRRSILNEGGSMVNVHENLTWRAARKAIMAWVKIWGKFSGEHAQRMMDKKRRCFE